MNITILKSYDLNKNNVSKSGRFIPRGMSLAEIQDLETALNEGTPFPKAFREYLYIGGKFNGIGYNDNLGDFVGLNKFYKERIKERGLKIDRPIMFMHNFEGEIGIFFYLDEATDDPVLWNCSVNEDYDSGDGKAIWKVPHPKFSTIVDDAVKAAVGGYSLW
ncbi:hypothetical protein [uncultured Chryseobacterium sp.]|uniref:hypothetical protein n=1 Tax=uncultured Chryseobacterium sp. TaxID=259322 RepID=UPI002584122E|nr:hypothetical protein [uncultured Chryseobacterium sp.]